MALPNNIAAVVVWYKPEVDYLTNLASFSSLVAHTWVIDNSSEDHSSWLIDFEAVTYVPFMKNHGVAYGMNQGCKLAIQNQYKYILTMDQDSSFDREVLIKHVNKALILMENPLVSIVAPTFKNEQIKQTKHPYEISSVITSGNILRLESWYALGGLRNQFFMDQIDHEFCIRLKKNGYKIYVNPAIVMKHKIGNPITKKIFGKLFTSSNHYWGQRYYYIRNSLYIRKIHSDYSKPLRLYFRDITMIILTTILVEKNVFMKILAMVLGYLDFLMNRFGSIQNNHPILFRERDKTDATSTNK